MISKSTLDEAKAFLCWDIFSELSVQLIEIQKMVSYFIPPSECPSIIIFYRHGETDFTKPLFNLFHEAGHLIQFNKTKNKNNNKKFRNLVNTPAGPKKINFEKQAWHQGKILFEDFIKKNILDISLLPQYDNYSKQLIDTYK